MIHSWPHFLEVRRLEVFCLCMLGSSMDWLHQRLCTQWFRQTQLHKLQSKLDKTQNHWCTTGHRSSLQMVTVGLFQYPHLSIHLRHSWVLAGNTISIESLC